MIIWLDIDHRYFYSFWQFNHWYFKIWHFKIWLRRLMITSKISQSVFWYSLLDDSVSFIKRKLLLKIFELFWDWYGFKLVLITEVRSHSLSFSQYILMSLSHSIKHTHRSIFLFLCPTVFLSVFVSFSLCVFLTFLCVFTSLSHSLCVNLSL